MKEALRALIHELEYVLSCINEGKVPFDGDDFHEALRLGKEALAQPGQRPTYGSEEVRKLREVIASQAKIIEDHIPDAKKMVAQRKPLTKGEIYTAYITATDQTLRPQDERLVFAFTRAIEAAHGIKENT